MVSELKKLPDNVAIPLRDAIINLRVTAINQTLVAAAKGDTVAAAGAAGEVRVYDKLLSALPSGGAPTFIAPSTIQVDEEII